jgi:hypothetical protein
MSMKLKTPDIDFAAAMMSKGAKLAEDLPWTKEGPRFFFCLENVTEQMTHEFRTGASTFSITAFTASRRFLIEVVKTEGR